MLSNFPNDKQLLGLTFMFWNLDNTKGRLSFINESNILPIKIIGYDLSEEKFINYVHYLKIVK